MTAPTMPIQGAPAPRDSRGFVHTGGGYEQALQQQQQAPMPAAPQPLPFVQPGGYPVSNLPPASVPVQPQTVPQPVAQPVPAAPVQQQFQQPAVQPQPQQPGTLPNDASIPAELRGRTMADAFKLYEGMKRVITNGMIQPPAPQAPPAAPVSPATAAPQASNDFWKDPAGNIRQMVQDAVQQTVTPIMAPVTHQTMQTAIQAAADQVAAEIGPDFARLQPAILDKLRGADPRALSNPLLWRTAATAALGEAVLAQRSGGTQPAPAPASPSAPPALTQPQFAQPSPAPTGQFPPVGQPAPLSAFFTEAPSSGAGPAQPGLSSQELWMAGQLGMTAQDYSLWKNGVTHGQR